MKALWILLPIFILYLACYLMSVFVFVEPFRWHQLPTLTLLVTAIGAAIAYAVRKIIN